MSFEKFLRIMTSWMRTIFRASWWLARHPRTLVLVMLGYWAALVIGITPVLLAGLAGSLLWTWRVVGPESFERILGRRYRSHWRRVFRYELGWRMRMRLVGLADQLDGRVAVPRLVKVVSGPDSDHLILRLVAGQTPEDVDAAAGQLAHAYRARHCRVRTLGPGVVQTDLQFADVLEAIVEPAPLTANPDLGGLEIGMREDGWPWQVRLLGSHILIAGVTRSGTGSVVWSLVRRLAPAIRDRTVDIWAIDPKGGMELAPGKALFARFAAGDFVEMADLLDDAVELMRARAIQLAGHTRQHRPTSTEPLVVVLVDEVANLTAYLPDRKLRDRITQSLAVLLTQGRAVGVSVVAALQDPRKEVLGLRNLFPTKIALRLDERTQVDMVLGDAARELGADCDRISEATPGVGFVRTDGMREPMRVRASWISDREIARIAAIYARENEEWTGLDQAARHPPGGRTRGGRRAGG
jgi:DNA segregation ATPase FtsK/SpoIIIE, S-DNA-T family